MTFKKQFQFVTIFSLSLLISLGSLAQKQVKPTKINFISFTVSSKENKVIINWATDSTVETNYFEIQKSVDGINFKTIALVLGPDPKQTNCDCYGCFDKLIAKTAKQSYYRLKHIDINGAEQLTDAKQIANL